jgi:hypothetical protein
MAEETAYSYQAPDELVYNLLTGRGDQFGLLPTVADYYRSQFEQLGQADTNPFTYQGERIAGFSPREELAMQLADQGIGSFQPFLSRAGGLSEEALATLAGGTSEAKSQLLRALQQGEDYTRFGIDEGAEFVGAGVDKASEAERGLLNALSGVRGRGEEGYQSGLANILQGAREGRAGLDQAQPFFTQARQAGLAGADDAERLARAAQAQADPFISEALGGVRAGQREELSGIGEARSAARRARDLQSPFIQEALSGTRTGVNTLLGRTGEAAQLARGAERSQDPFIQEALGQTRASTAGFDTADIGRFQNPFEDAVVQQTIQDLQKAQAQSDIARSASEISSGAFGGSRSRLGAQESQIAATRGLAEALSGIRAGGFTSARDAAMGEFGRQRAAEASAAGTTAGLGAQRAGARTGLASLIAGLGGQEAGAITGAASQIANLGGQRAGAESQLAQTLAGLGAQSGAARRGSAAEIAGLGGQRGAALERLASTVGNLGGARAGFETGTGTALSNLAQQRFGIGTGTGSQQAGLGAQSAAAQLAAAQAGQGAKQATAATLGQAGQQLFGMGTGAGQQLFGMGSGAGQQLSELAGQLAGGQQAGAQAMTGLAQLTPQLRAGDVQSLMNVGAMNRARNQAQLDLNYQNFVGQYNMPQQLASGFANFLTGAGPLAGGTGYSGTTPATPFGQPGQGTYTGGSFYSEGGQGGTGKPIPEGNKGLVSLANKAPEVVKRMGFQVPQKKRSGGIVNARFPMASRKLGA